MSVELQASIITGFEVVAQAEVEEKLSTTCGKHRGFVRFQGQMDEIHKSLQLRSIDNLYVVLEDTEIEGLCEMKTEEATEALKRLMEQVRWSHALDCWQTAFDKQIDGGTDLLKTKMKRFMTEERSPTTEKSNFKYRVTCDRAGPKSDHLFSSMDAARWTGAHLNNIFGWKPSMKEYDMEVVIKLNRQSVVVLVALNNNSLFKRNILSFGPTTMRSTMCYCMVTLAKPQKGQLIVDPMCGGGSIPIEGSLAFPQTVFVGGDTHEKAMERCKENRQTGNVEFIQMDATCLPFSDETVDAVVTDLPFGRKIGSTTDNRLLYPRLLQEWHRILKPNGRLVMMTHDKRSIETTIGNMENKWRRTWNGSINVGGLTTLCLVLQRQ